MKWILASERLPGKGKQVNGMLQGRPAIVCNSNLVDGYITANGNLEPLNLVEWLDKQPSSEDKEINELSRKVLSMEGQLLEKDFEIERLKGLIEKAYQYGVSVVGQHYSPAIYWKGFQEENNLY